MMHRFKKAFDNTCKIGLNNRADFLKILGATGLILSCLAQTGAIIFNPKIDKKEKNFLIPQEIADGALNSTFFWFLTSKLTNLSKKLVYTKKIIPNGLDEVLKGYKPQGNNIKELEKSFLNFVGKNCDAACKKTALTTVNGVGLLGMIAGSILSVNIITPFIRNKIAGIFQQKALNKTDTNAILYKNLANLDYSKFNKTFAYTKNRVCSYNMNMKI